jgi:hypothetical protein
MSHVMASDSVVSVEQNGIRNETQPLTRDRKMATSPYRRPAQRRSFAAAYAPYASRPAQAKPLTSRSTLLSGETISNILRFADVEEDLGGGKVLNKLSERRLQDAEVRAVFGPDLTRAAQVSVVWDEREGQIARVYDAGQMAA